MSNEFRSLVPLLRGITTLLGLDAPDSGLVRLAEELYVILDPVSRDEFSLPREEYIFAKNITVAAGGVGNRSIAQLHNDSADAIVVLKYLTVSAQAVAGDFVFSRTNIQATTDVGLTAQVRDGRFQKPAVPYARLRSQNNAALPAGINNGQFWEVDVPASTPFVLPFDYILRPQDTLSIYPATDNTLVRANFAGYTRRTINRRELSPLT